MPTKFQWNDKEFSIETRLSPKRLFWGTDTTLRFDGNEILKASGSGFSMNDENTFLDASNQERHIHLNVYPRALSMRYCFRVDGVEVSAGELIPENLLIGMTFILIQGFLALYILRTLL